MKRWLILVALAACASAIAAEKPPITIGPFTLGMSLDQARAAAPELEWRDAKLSQYTHKTTAIRAEKALVLGGVAHSVEIEPGYYGDYAMRLAHTAADGDADDCQKLALPVLDDLETRFGRLTAQPHYKQISGGSGMRWETQRTKDGGIIVLPVAGSGPIMQALPHERLKGSKRSFMIFEAREGADGDEDGPSDVTGYAEYRNRELHVRLESRYRRSSAAERCQVETSIRIKGKAPTSRSIELPADLLAREQTIAVKHHSLDIAGAPTQNVTLAFDCSHEHRDGRLQCAPSRSQQVDAKWIDAVQARIAAIRLPDSLTDPDNPAPLRTHLRIVIAPMDRRPLDFVSAVRTPVRDIAWAAYPDEAAMPLYRSQGEGIVPVACQVQSDGSLICAALDASNAAVPPPLATVSQVAAVNILRRYVASPTLKSGSPSAGTVFSTTVDFRER